ncbi:MAG TPA: ABC transporter ATP-binding protein [Longimicrobiales bacterium]|nr:ABC transporter ATP-binding protein [Longimicrobiales bacterium]
MALARALAPEPPVLLLDEPLSNLDASLRERTRTELRALLTRLGITSIFVTHDQEEAFALSDRVAVMQAGRLEQIEAPEVLYRDPATPFVASFLGRANFLPARAVAEREGALVCELDGGVRWPALLGGGALAGDEVRLMIRPEDVRLSQLSSENVSGVPSDALQGEVVTRRFAGALTHYTVRAGRLDLVATGGAAMAEPGARVMVRPAETAREHAYSARAAAETSPEAAEASGAG